MSETGSVLKCKCGFITGPKYDGDKTAGARFATHQRFCTVANPERASASRKETAKRLTSSRGQELLRDRELPPESAPDTGVVLANGGGVPASAKPVAKIDLGQVGLEIDAVRASPPNASSASGGPVPYASGASPPTPPAPTPPAPAKSPIETVESEAAKKRKLAMGLGDWTDISEALHDAEGGLVVAFTKNEKANIPPTTKKALDRVMAKLLTLLWEDLTVADSIKVLAAIYGILQLSYAGYAVRVVREDKAAKKAAEDKDGRELA